MTLAAPMALWWAAAGVAIIALYLLKTRQRRVPVSTVMFWEQVFEQSRPRAWWRQLRHVLSLLMQLLIATLLVLAIAELTAPWQSLEPRRIAVIIDTSASMSAPGSAPGDGGTRLDAAKDAARNIIDNLGDFDEAAIITAGGAPRAACGMTSHRRTLLDAVESVAPTRAVGQLDNAVTIARDAADEVVLITDVDVVPEGVTPLRVGQTADNLAVTRLGVRRSLIDPVGYHILAEVRSFAVSTVSCRFELSLGDQVLDVVPITLEPGGVWKQVFEKTSAEGGVLEAKLEADDAWGADNVASAVLPPRKPVRIVLRGERNVFVARAIDALPLVQAAGEGETPDITVYHRDAPAALPPVPALVIDPRGETDLWHVGDVLHDPIVAKQDDESPLMAHVKLQNVHIPESRRIEPRGDCVVLAAGPDGEPIVAAFDRSEGRVVVIAADVAEGDLPLRTAFPILMTNAMNWLTGAGGEQMIAADLIDPAECDLRMSAEDADAKALRAGGRPMWFYLLCAVVVLLFAEWWLHQRRWIS